MVIFIESLSIFMNISRKPRYPFSYFRHFSPKIVRNQPKKMIKLQFYILLLVKFQLCIPGLTLYNLGYVQNQFYWLQYFEITLKQSFNKITLYFRQLPVHLYWVPCPSAILFMSTHKTKESYFVQANLFTFLYTS